MPHAPQRKGSYVYVQFYFKLRDSHNQFNEAALKSVEPSVHSIDTALTAFLRTRKHAARKQKREQNWRGSVKDVMKRVLLTLALVTLTLNIRVSSFSAGLIIIENADEVRILPGPDRPP